VQPITKDANGFTYIARFSYNNPNLTAIYIPVGTDNIISGLGKFETSKQPVLFLPGCNTFEIRFDGTKITWKVASYCGTTKTTSTTYASSASNKCYKSAETLAEESEDAQPTDSWSAYPNPTTSKVYINLGNQMVSQQDISVFDHLGKAIQVGIQNPGGPILEIDFSELHAGMYIIRIRADGEYKLFQVIRK
jgi:hypothetical protein